MNICDVHISYVHTITYDVHICNSADWFFYRKKLLQLQCHLLVVRNFNKLLKAFYKQDTWIENIAREDEVLRSLWLESPFVNENFKWKIEFVLELNIHLKSALVSCII